jgi:alpha-D-xyloside xylohydrolase
MLYRGVPSFLAGNKKEPGLIPNIVCIRRHSAGLCIKEKEGNRLMKIRWERDTYLARLGNLYLYVSIVFGMIAAPQRLWAGPGENATPIVQSVNAEPNAVFIHMNDGTLRIEPCAGNIARISFATGDSIPAIGTPEINESACPITPFHMDQTDRMISINMEDIHLTIDRRSGAIHYYDAADHSLVSESSWPYPRMMRPAADGGGKYFRASTWFALTPEESFYGLGQHQNGVLNQRNLEMELSQDNTNISIPFFLSSKGYGILWNNASATRWNNRFQPVLELQSSLAKEIDYFFIAGPGFDRIIAGYRALTGAAPLYPLWAYGYWQSKLGYTSQTEMLSVAAKYRNLHIPIDNIVLDAGYETKMGSRVFNENFPDPKAMVQTLHDEHIHMMASVWPFFQPGSDTFSELDGSKFFVDEGKDVYPAYFPGSRLYNAYNAEARKLYWKQIKKSLFDIGVDAFWMDSTEPGDLYAEEHGSILRGATIADEDGASIEDAYPFMTTKAIYDGQRSITDKQRVFILTRSGFLGMQRNAATAWSGDIATNFSTLRREIPAGLNYSMSGLPYWTTDVGGFLGGDTDDPKYRELFVRWFQYGAFCPIFRVHGTRTNNQNELWSYGKQAQDILTLYDRLHYRLLPYNYTLAARTTLESYTPMRALAFDFSGDPNTLDIDDEFMLGPSVLVAPVTEAGAVNRSVYLPANTEWYDFWTGAQAKGGKRLSKPTPLSIMPLYIRAGSILPLGPELQYAAEKPDAPMELRIYPGDDGSFRLYEDDGATYNYEEKQYSWIPMQWDDATQTLTLGAREGSFPGQQVTRSFNVVVIGAGKGVGENETTGRLIKYDGTFLALHLAASHAPRKPR